MRRAGQMFNKKERKNPHIWKSGNTYSCVILYHQDFHIYGCGMSALEAQDEAERAYKVISK